MKTINIKINYEIYKLYTISNIYHTQYIWNIAQNINYELKIILKSLEEQIHTHLQELWILISFKYTRPKKNKLELDEWEGEGYIYIWLWCENDSLGNESAEVKSHQASFTKVCIYIYIMWEIKSIIMWRGGSPRMKGKVRMPPRRYCRFLIFMLCCSSSSSFSTISSILPLLVLVLFSISISPYLIIHSCTSL